MRPEQDAFGRLLLDYFETGRAQEIVERDDGLIAANLGAGAYFQPFRGWPPVERRALRYVRGRVGRRSDRQGRVGTARSGPV